MPDLPTLYRPRLWWTLGALWVLAVIALSLMPAPPEVPGDPGNHAAHCVAYAWLMGWFARLAAPDRRARWAIGLVLLGIGVEFAQGLTGYRTLDPQDMLANSCGVLLGWIVSPPRVPSGLLALDRLLAGTRRAA